MQLNACDQSAIAANFRLLKQLYPALTAEDYALYTQEMQTMGYRQTGVFVDGECIAVAGFHTATHLSSGRYMYVNDLVADENHRHKGYGKILLTHLEGEAAKLGCNYIFLDAFVENSQAHRLYHREGFAIAAFHFIKSLKSSH